MEKKQVKKKEGSREKQEEKEEKLGRRRKKKKRRQQVHHQAYQVVSKIEMMMSPTKCRRGTRMRRKERAKPTTTNMPPYPLTILLCL